MKHEVHWSAQRNIAAREPLRGTHRTNVTIVGGGIAGLTVAQQLVERGIDGITIIDASICGGGATGRSSGFITAASELGLDDLLHHYGEKDGKELWDAAQESCDAISTTIKTDRIECGFLEADSFYVASDKRSFAAIRDEHDARERLGYQSRIYAADDVHAALGAGGYAGAVRWAQSFAIDGFAYARALSERLEGRGVRIFESSPVVKIEGTNAITDGGAVHADLLFVCADRWTADIGVARDAVYHALTFLMISEPLLEELVRSMFPDAPLLVWDTDLVYQYFRLTPDRRLLVGGSLLRKTYASRTGRTAGIRNHLHRYVHARFPQLAGVQFEKWWEGFIGVSKDFLPLAGRLAGMNRTFIAACAAGLPWSVLAAKQAVQIAYEGKSRFERFLSPQRKFTAFDRVQPLLRRRLTFALSHAALKV